MKCFRRGVGGVDRGRGADAGKCLCCYVDVVRPSPSPPTCAACRRARWRRCRAARSSSSSAASAARPPRAPRAGGSPCRGPCLRLLVCCSVRMLRARDAVCTHVKHISRARKPVRPACLVNIRPSSFTLLPSAPFCLRPSDAPGRHTTSMRGVSRAISSSSSASRASDRFHTVSKRAKVGASSCSVSSATTPSSPRPPDSARASALPRGDVWTAPPASTHVASTRRSPCWR